MANSDPQVLVSTQWLADHLDAPDLRVLDATWFMPSDERNAYQQYESGHIAGARFFDIDDVADSNSDMSHMAPPVEKFISKVRALGVGDGHRVVIYDQHGLFSATRVWWLFRLMGQNDVAVLDGGLPKWIADGHPVTSDKPLLRDRHITARRDAGLVKDVTQVAAASKLHQAEIIDARAPERFRGEVEEPRVGLRSGHIPGSKNVFYKSLLNDDATMKSNAEIQAIFEEAGVDLQRPAITTCGSGITAAVLSLALEKIGHRNHSLYDGSWAEWGMYEDLKIETGPANV